MVALLKEQENFLRNAILTVDHSKEALQDLIEKHLQNSHQSFEDFINQNQHEIYHLYYDSKCCQCEPGSFRKKKRILLAFHMELLFDKKRQLPVHKVTRCSDFCCSYAKPNVTTAILDLSLARSLLVNCCIGVFWFSCLSFKGVTFEQFLNSNNHIIYHLWRNNDKCCKCQPDFSFPSEVPLITESEWQHLFRSTLTPCSEDCGRLENGSISMCSVEATKNVSEQQLGLELQKIILQYCCSTRISVDKLAELRNLTFGHMKKARIPCAEFDNIISEAGDAILDIANVCGKEHDFRRMLQDLHDKPLDTRMFCQYEKTLLQTISNYEDIIAENEVLKDGIESLKISNVEMKQKIEDLYNLHTEGLQRRRLIEITKTIVEIEYKKTSPFFVETKGYKEIRKLLNEKHSIVIKGNPGDGKTALAIHAMFELIQKGNRPLQIHSYKEFDKYVSPNQNLIIFIDNLFGEFSVSKDDVTQWSSRSKALEAAVFDGQRRNYTIIAIRNDIYQESRRLLKSDDFLQSNVVDISHGCKFGLNSEEMGRMFTKYTDQCIPEVNWFDNLPKIGFPQCCRLYRDTEEIRKEGLDFFKNPLKFLIKEIEFRLDDGDMKMAVLVCILLHGGSVKSSLLHDNSMKKELKCIAMDICSVDKDLLKFQRAISNTSFTTTVQGNNEDIIKFSHSSVQNAIFLVIGKHAPFELIEYCDFRLLSMITTSECRSQKIESLEIPDSCISVLCDRIRELLRKRVVFASLLKVISGLNIWNDPRVFRKCLEFDNFFVQATDENNWSMLVYFSAVGCIKWVQHLFDKLPPQQASIALEIACGANELNVVKFILSKGCMPNIKCCFKAVKGGHLDIILELEKAGVDLTETCRTQTQWNTTTSVLDEAAMQNQCHLIEPLLKICPGLINVKSSFGETAIHFAAEAGDIALLEKFIALPEFSPFDISDIGSTILHFACQNNKFETVKYIISKYPILLTGKYYCFSDGTVLHTAAQSGNSDLFQYVLQQNENLLETNKLDTIQLYRNCHVKIDNETRNLVHRSMILHVRDYRGLSILHHAVRSQSIKMVKFIVSKGLDIVNCVSDQGLNVVEFMCMKPSRYTDMDEMLLFLKEEYNI